MSSKPERRWTKVKENEVYDERPWFYVTKDDVLRPDGKQITYGVVHNGDVVVIIPVASDGRLALIRQHRYPVDSDTWEFAAGGMETGLEVAAQAAAELHEEMGIRGVKLEKLGHYFGNPARLDTTVHLFVARDIDPQDFSLEHQESNETINEIRLFTGVELFKLIRNNQDLSGGTLAALNLYWLKYGFPTED